MNGEAICRNCGTEIKFVSQRPDEGWEKQWRHLPSGAEVVGPRRCPFYAEPVEGIDGYCTCHPDQRGMTADCGVRQHRRAASHWKERDQ